MTVKTRKKSSSKFLSFDEELRLIALAQSGDVAARNTLIEKHYAFIWRATARHLSRQRMFTVEELIGEAVIGYIRAIQKFDATRQIRLNTYADYWIRNHLQCAVASGRHAVSVPIYIQRNGPGAARSEECKAAAANATRSPAYLSTLIDDEGRPIDLPQREREDGGLPFTSEELHAAIARLGKSAREVVYRRMSGRTYAESGVEMGMAASDAHRLYQASAPKIGRLLLGGVA